MKFGFAILLSLVTRDRIDYLPDAHRPWLVRFRYPVGRGQTLRKAIVHNLLRGYKRGPWLEASDGE